MRTATTARVLTTEVAHCATLQALQNLDVRPVTVAARERGRVRERHTVPLCGHYRISVSARVTVTARDLGSVRERHAVPFCGHYRSGTAPSPTGHSKGCGEEFRVSFSYLTIS